MKFKKGDRVRAVHTNAYDHSIGIQDGMEGTALQNSKNPYVKWDEALQDDWCTDNLELIIPRSKKSREVKDE